MTIYLFFYYGLVFFWAASMGVPKSCNLQRMDSLSFSIFLLIFLLLSYRQFLLTLIPSHCLALSSSVRLSVSLFLELSVCILTVLCRYCFSFIYHNCYFLILDWLPTKLKRVSIISSIDRSVEIYILYLWVFIRYG